MWQKFLFLSFLIILSCMFAKANAQTVMVSALNEISTAKPTATVSVKLDEPLTITNEQILNSGVIITGALTDIKRPKRLKRNAKFSIEPKTYTDENGEVCKISKIKATYKTKPDKKSLAKKAALKAGGLVVKGLTPQVAIIEGAIKNEEGNVVKSSLKSLYKASPLSYVEKGNDIDIKPEQQFYLKFADTTKSKKGSNNI